MTMRYYLDGEFFADWAGSAQELADFSSVDVARLSQDAGELRAELLARLAAQYEARTAVMSAPYPPSERESWPVQTGEARSLLVDAGAITPWLDAACAARGLSRIELAQRIAEKDAIYRAAHGAITGVRQRIEDSISAAAGDAAALASIDVAAGWPVWEAL